MKANELLKKLGHKLLGKKENTPAADDLATINQPTSQEKTPEVPPLDGLGVIELHPYWRN